MNEELQKALKRLEESILTAISQEKQLPPVLSIKEAAEAAKVSTWTIRDVLNRGEIKRVRGTGKKIYISTASLLRWSRGERQRVC